MESTHPLLCLARLASDEKVFICQQGFNLCQKTQRYVQYTWRNSDVESFVAWPIYQSPQFSELQTKIVRITLPEIIAIRDFR
jgi:hypothetical protein